jgi:hypothetical protein
MLPAFPLLAAAAVLALVRAAPRAAAVLVFLGAGLQLAEVARVHPHEISFFNVLAGGPERGEAWLNDSNLDWGQDLARLGVEMHRRGEAAGLTVAYFGGDEPAYRLPRARVFEPTQPDVRPGLYAVSSFLLCCGPETLVFHGDVAGARGLARLRAALRERGMSAGRVGYSIHLFRVPGAGPSER